MIDKTEICARIKWDLCGGTHIFHSASFGETSTQKKSQQFWLVRAIAVQIYFWQVKISAYKRRNMPDSAAACQFNGFLFCFIWLLMYWRQKRGSHGDCLNENMQNRKPNAFEFNE